MNRALAALALTLMTGCGNTPRLDTVPLRAAERIVIDTRTPEAFAAGHVEGALNLQVAYGQLVERVDAYVPDRATPIAVWSASQDEARRAAALLIGAGYEEVAVAPFEDAGPAQAELCLIDAEELRRRLASAEPPVLIDVRTEAEFATGTITGALLVDQDEAPRLARRLDRTRSYAIICEGGYRSSQLASLLAREGFPDVCNVIDGMRAWRR